jgi:hypothetical protein
MSILRAVFAYGEQVSRAAGVDRGGGLREQHRVAGPTQRITAHGLTSASALQYSELRRLTS